jgi:cysteine-rich repeat protein
MARHTTPRRAAFMGIALLVALAGADLARAQSVSSLSITKNAGNSADVLQTTSDSFEVKTTVAISSSTATSFTTRYAEILGADSDLFANQTTTGNSDYTVQFTVTAPGSYYLTVDTSLIGSFTLNNDGNSASADLSAVTGSQTGGTLTSGTLSLADPGSLSGASGGDMPFNETASARIDGTSNGSPVTHTLRFTWNGTCVSTALVGLAFGDDCAVRLGLPTDYSDPAGAYPGVGNRTQANDGHFVTVTLTSLCGNGTLDPGEQCDDGNNTNGDCCSSSCQFEPSTTVCRSSAGVCDLAETCTGSSGTCPADAKSTAVCRPSVGVCDLGKLCANDRAGFGGW